MLSFIGRRLTYANVVSTVCLFVVLGGGAYAAARAATGVVHGCVASDGTLHIIRAGHKCGSHQRSLTFNRTGPKGAAGVRGPAGPPGPGHAFSATTQLATIVPTGATVTTLTLPAGSYDVAAKLWVQATDTGTF